jgi:hypothetical protein
VNFSVRAAYNEAAGGPLFPSAPGERRVGSEVQRAYFPAMADPIYSLLATRAGGSLSLSDCLAVAAAVSHRGDRGRWCARIFMGDPHAAGKTAAITRKRAGVRQSVNLLQMPGLPEVGTDPLLTRRGHNFHARA